MSTKSSFALALLAACGGSARVPSTPEAAGSVVVDTSRKPLSMPIQAVTVRGELAALHAGSWQPIIEGGTASGVRELRATRRGAIVAFGSSADAPLLYLRAGTRVAVSDDERGVRIEVREGRVRVTRGSSSESVVVVTKDGDQLVSGDVLVDANPKVRSDVRSTASRVREAEWSFALTQEDTGAGAGRMEARASADKMEPVALRSLNVAVTTAGDQAITEVTHIFHNASAERREGTFRFPLPDGASLVGLAMEIDGKMMEGEFVERDKARAVYEKIVDEMLDPALLEWEQGNWFKLRVFPLEANGDKKIVIRYVAPLARAATGGWEYAYDVSVPGQAIDSLAVTVDGAQALAQRNVAQGVDLVVPVAATKVPSVMREERKDGTYAALRITPAVAWAATQRMPPATGRNVAIVIDTSRSSLEAREQELDVLTTTVRQLSPTDKFVVLASDVTVQESWAGYVPVDDQALARATKYIEGIEPDGATDLGATFAVLAARAPSDVIYVGDGLATWGELRTDALAQAAKKINAPIDAALVGKGASSELWAELAGVTGGRAMIVRSHLDEQRFAVIAGEPAAPRLVNAKLVAPTGAVLFPTTATTLAEGDEMLAVMKVPAGEKLPASVTLTGTLAGAPYSETIPLAAAARTSRVAQRWARHQLAAMEAADAPREDVVAMSTEFGVMSKYTSLLVLENDEAYKQYQIERKQAQAQAQATQLAQNTPTVTGGDLDTLGARQASLSPDEIQPGDPEIKIPAPRDAASVVVTFSFGETKLAEWDPAVGAWMVRFLVDQATADGVYYARVTITHSDGRVQVLRLPYTVDTAAPAIKVTATKLRNGSYKITARQQGRGPRDADRVEVAMPDGTTLRLSMKEWGKFEGTWSPASPLTAPLTLQVIARDNALNQSITELVLH